MLIGIFGESCTGKSTLADCLKEKLNARVFTGKDYLRLAKSEAEAKRAFQSLMEDAIDRQDSVIFVISEKDELSLLPQGAVRVLVTAELDVICQRFAARMHGHLPPPVAAMLERKHGCFDGEAHDVHIDGSIAPEDACEQIVAASASF